MTTKGASNSTSPSLEVKLEREGKVYYPGETVKGTVILRVPQATQCCEGVFLDFVARATNDFVTGGEVTVVNGKNEEAPRTVSQEETIFQRRTQTLLGAFHKTGTQNVDAMAVVDFEKIPGSGDIYIPCAKATKNRMTLKIEAIGSAMTLNVAKLVGKAGSEIFYLSSTVGNMQKGSVVLSAEFIDYSDAFSSAQVDACKKYEHYLLLRVHKLRDVPKGTRFANVTVLDLTNVQEGNPKTAQCIPMESGTKTFPFNLKLREDAPGSANWNIGMDSAGISYSIKAVIDSNLYVSQTMFTVIANRPLPRPSLLSPYKMVTGDQPWHTFRCCRPKGNIKYTVSINLHLGRLVYAPGEVIDMTGSTVINNSTLPQRAQIVLCSYLELKGSNNQKRALSHHHVCFETEIPSQKSVILTNLPEYEMMRVPAVYPSYSGVYLSHDKKTRLDTCVKWAYTLEIRLPDWGAGFFCRTPLLISATPPFVHQLQEYRNVKSDPLLTGQYSIFEHAVSGVTADCKTGPTLKSSKKDKGRKVLVHEDEPVWIGDRNDYESWMKIEANRKRLEEWSGRRDAKDEAFCELDKMFHRNLVNVYAGPSGTFDESIE